MWEWPVQQRPMKWAALKRLLERIGPDSVLVGPLGEWVTRQGHKKQQWLMMFIEVRFKEV
jgi:hypothetical protein